MKNILRKDLIERRNNLDKETVRLKSKLIGNKLFETEIFKTSKNVGLYFSKENEVYTEEVIVSMLVFGKKIFLPRINGNKLEFREIRNVDDLEKGNFGIMEPKESRSRINFDKLDLLIIPCVAVDKNGNRIGRGAGFYDRFLVKHKPIKTACLAYDFQVLNEIKEERHDQKVDLIITEKRVIEVDKKNNYKLLDGKNLAEEILLELKKKIDNEKIRAKLAVVLIGNNPASEVYVKNKKKKCAQVGVDFELIRFKDDISEDELIKKIEELNNNKVINGILVQLPLPKNIDANRVINTILPEKDVDGLTNINMEKLTKGDEILACPTPKGIIKLLEKNKIHLNGKKIVLVGHGRLVGKPLSLMFKNRKLKLMVCDKKTGNLKEEAKKADILISATGVPHLIKKENVKKGVVIIDAGTSKLNGKIVGDVDLEGIKEKASWITPLFGGVGPMTIAMLIENTIKAYKLQNS